MTRYGLFGPDFKTLQGKAFPNPHRPALRLTQLTVQRAPGIFLVGVKATGAWGRLPNQSSAEVQKSGTKPPPLLTPFTVMACYTVKCIVTLTTGTQQKHMIPPLNVAVTANWRPIAGLTKDNNQSADQHVQNRH